MLFVELARTSEEVATTSGNLKKVAQLAGCLSRMTAEERAIGARYLAGEVPQKTGIGWAMVQETKPPPATEPSLGIVDVDRRFAAIAASSGPGSVRARKEQLGALLALATAPEQKLIAALAVGDLRQGALAGVVAEAIAKASELPAAEVRRAHMLAGDIGVVAETALGEHDLSRFGLQLFRPVLPMLAQTADDAESALAALEGPAMFEHKVDGFRVQIHKDGDDVRIYSRGLNDVTAFAPEVAAAALALPSRRAILDGEAISLHPDGRPRVFQDTMRRFGKSGLALARELPLTLSLFDALMVDDQTLLAEPTRTRIATLDAIAPSLVLPRIVTSDADEAEAFYQRAIDSGQEGVMAKALDAAYDAGNRGSSWLKIKRVHRLDLVVLAAEWGSGRRKGWLSNIHLGARDGAGFVMLGKTFKGMTDAMLKWQTTEFLAREIGREGHIVHVRPEIVAEVAFNDVQRSTRYPGGLALRLARVVRYRDDKTAAQADTIDAVRAIAIASGVIPG
ncbi:MAG: ATP-dependent DNA ligase [Polyangiales bacterium]